MSEMYNIIESLCKAKKVSITKMCSEAEISRGSLTDLKKGRSNILSSTTLKKIAEYFGVSTDVLMNTESTPAPAGKGIKIPVLGKVQAGVPVEAVEEILDYEEITKELAETGEFFALKIRGESMTPRMLEGDVVIVRQQPDVDSGDIAVILVDGENATVKKLVKHDNGISLVSFNPAFPPMFYTCEEIKALPIVVLGKVIELRGKF